MSIAAEISRIQSAKADIKSAIEAKGVTVPSSATIDTYDDYISQISGGGGTELNGIIDRTISGSLTIPSGITSIGDYAFYNCRGLTSINVPSGITSIGTYAFYNCSGLSSINIPSGITSIGAYAFSHAGSHDKSIDLSSIDLSNVSPSSDFHHIFENAYIYGNITIPNSLLSGATSAYTSTCYYLFSTAYCLENHSLTINIYADNRIIPRNMCQLSNATTISKGKVSIIVHGTPTFLSPQSFRVISGTEVAAQSVTFADCTTPPDALSYGTSTSSPFYGLTGIIYVPSSSLDAWKAKYTGAASRIQAIPENWVLVEESGVNSPRKVKVDYSLIEDDDSAIRDDYDLGSHDLGTYEIIYLNQPTLEWMMQEGYGGDELAEYYQKVGLFSSSDGIIGILEDGVEYTSIGGITISDMDNITPLKSNYYLYATQ